jgi:hypothetical protein
LWAALVTESASVRASATVVSAVRCASSSVRLMFSASSGWAATAAFGSTAGGADDACCDMSCILAIAARARASIAVACC